MSGLEHLCRLALDEFGVLSKIDYQNPFLICEDRYFSSIWLKLACVLLIPETGDEAEELARRLLASSQRLFREDPRRE